MRTSLLSSVSHDLRNRLTVITGSSNVLLELGDAADVTQRAALLEEVIEESDRLVRLVDNLLSVTRLDAGTVKVEKESCSLEDVIDSALERLSKELTDRSVNEDLSPDLPLLPMDSLLIEQVLMNLLENALRYTDAASPIDVRAQMESEGVVVSVSDRGPGLEPGEEEQVFERLFRGSASTASLGRGSGLGLFIAQGIIRAHGGRIWAENRPGGGASFSLLLPIGEASPHPSANEEERGQA